MTVTPEFRRLRREESKFKASLEYTVKSQSNQTGAGEVAHNHPLAPAPGGTLF